MPVVCVLATTWLWSLIPLAVKAAYASFNPAFIAFARLAGGAIVFVVAEIAAGRGIRLPAKTAPVTLLGPKRIGLRGWIIVAAVGICGDLLLYTLGLRYTTASAATLIVSTDGIMLALLGVLVIGEPMSWFKAAAGLTALAGLFLVSWNGQDLTSLLQSRYLVGNILVICAACCWATYALGQRVLARVPGGTLVPVFILAVLIAIVPAVSQPAMHAPLRLSAAAALLYLAFGGTGLAYILLVKGMAKLEAATVGLLCSLLPLFTMVEARLILRETITVYLVGGAILVIAGVSLMMAHQRIYGDAGDPSVA
jgi:drug/metabolite transporter (DMT)-like permease